MSLRCRFTSLLFLFGLLASPAMAGEEPSKPAEPAKTEVKAEAPKQSEEERENDIWKTERKDTIDAGKLFGKIIGHLADTYELHLISVKIPLPILFIDGFGMHFFSSMEKLEESGTYKLRDPDKYAELTKVPFGFTTPWERVDGKPLGFTLDLSMTANRVFLLVAMFVLILLTWSAGRKSKKSLVPKGNQNLIESVVVYVRDEIVYPNIEKKWADRLMPYFLTVFFFIFIINLIGLFPLTKTPTGNLAVTVTLAICTFILTQIMGIRTMGLSNYLKHFTGGLHEMDIPFAMKIVLIAIMVPIEFIGLFTKPFALTMRLFANMTAGHIVIGALIGLALLFQSVIAGFAVSVPFALFIYLLELLVAALQAFVFTMLSAVFVGMMVHEHHHEEHETKEERLAEVSI
ncbi:MAG: F0F1 ATP synthase subunit A [Bacteroidota bacterium]|nr:F0F1 ATP synthase subunit A [Bacteroidota bacterium]